MNPRVATLAALAAAVEAQMPGVWARVEEILEQPSDIFTIPGGRVGYECPIRDPDTGASIVIRFPAVWSQVHIRNLLTNVAEGARQTAPRVGAQFALRGSAAFAVAAAEYAMLALDTPKARA